MIFKHNIYIVSHEFINDIIDNARYVVNTSVDNYREEFNNTPVARNTVFIKNNEINDNIDYFDANGVWHNYILDKSIIRPKDYKIKYANIVTAIAAFIRTVQYEKLPILIPNLGARHYANPKYMNTELKNCFGYDVNKMYLSLCSSDQLPVKYLGELDRDVAEDEVGFDMLTGEPIYSGNAYYIFKKGKISGLCTWAKRMIKRLTEVKDNPDQKSQLKLEINACIGYLGKNENMENNNRFIRNTIVWLANKFIADRTDENTLFSNTDSIVSLVERTDLPISDKIGDFKIEHFGTFKYTNEMAYQWNTERPNTANRNLYAKYIEKYGKAFDILHDDLGMLKDLIAIKFNESENIYEETK